MNMGFIIYRGTKEEVEGKMKEIKIRAKEGYSNFYKETKDGFELKTEDVEINFSVDRTINKDEYGIYQIFY